MHRKKIMQTLFLMVALLMTVNLCSTGHVRSAEARIQLSEGPLDFDGDLGPYLGAASAPTGDTTVDYLLYDHYGGTWSDAEKTADNTDDDLMCWAAGASNILEWTGWGFVVHPTEGTMTNTDEMFAHFQAHWTDLGSLPNIAWHWWFDGTEEVPGPGWSSVDVPGGGDFWTPPYNFGDWTHQYSGADTLQHIDEYLSNGWGVTLGIYDGGHCITCWGFRYDSSVDKTTNPHDYYKGIWVTDSDDDKWFSGPGRSAPDSLRYYDVSYNSGSGYWEFPNYGGGGWHIEGVYALEPFPNTAPTAEANGPYTGFEGTSAILFDGSGSSDPDGNPLRYRWDFNNDGTWDTNWDTSPYALNVYPDDYNGLAVMQVSDYITESTDTANVVIYNVPPTVEAGPDQTVYSGDTVGFSGSFTDPGILDTFTIEWDFGDGTPKATGTLTPTHMYLVAKVYTITLTVTDDDGGVGVDTLTVTVERIPVPIDIKPGSFPNSINQNDNGFIPVAILNDASWTPYYIDPALVDPSSAVFGPNKASPVKWSYEDVDLDGDIDLILFFKTQETGIMKGDTSATLYANLTDGRQIIGVDSIWAAPRKKI